MVRGFLGGVFWGAIVGAVVLLTASLIAPLPGEGPVAPQPAVAPEPEPAPEAVPTAPQPPASEPPPATPEPPAAAPVAPPAAPETRLEVPPGSEFARGREDAEPAAPGADAEPLPAAPPPEVAVPETALVTPPPAAALEPAARPQAQEEAAAAPDVPETPAEAPVAPAAESGGAALAPAPPPGAPGTPEGPPQAPSAAAPSSPPVPDAATPQPEALAQAMPQPEAEAAEPALRPEAEPEPEPEPAAPAAVPGAPPVVSTEAPSGIGQPAGAFGSMGSDIPTARLPRIGDPAPEAEDGAETEAAAETVAQLLPAAELGALARHAAPFENAAGKPLMSVILIDEGASGLDRAALTTFPFPVTFAIPAAREDAAEAAAAFRKAGYEVVILAEGLPAGAAPADLEVAFGAFRAAVSEAVAVIDAPQGGFQGDRALVSQVAAILAETGHGLLAFDRGLNAVQSLAERAGVPAALVFRELDAAGEDAATLRRALDRAAFKAGQDGRVIVLGRSRPETVTALFSWALEGRAEAVALAPVSAVLRGQ